MKRHLLSCICLVLLCCCIACKKDLDPTQLEDGIADTQIENQVSASIVEGDTFISNPTITLVLQNNTDTELGYGEEFRLEVKLQNNWYLVDAKPGTSVTAIGILLKPGDTNQHTINLSEFYDKLPSGEYRILKQIGNGYTATEFKIV